VEVFKMKSLSYLFAVLLVVVFLQGASATLKLDNIQFDPAIIAAGDEVDIIVQFHHEGSEEDEKIASPEYTFGVTLEADDTLAEQYVIIQDAKGDNLQGRVFADGHYNKKFRVKIAQNAVPGNYEFKLSGQWFKNGVPEAVYQYVRFDIPVKKEGISIGVSNIISVPEKVRAGDKNVLLKASLYNSGEKAAKNVRIRLSYPDGLSSSYTNNNQLFIGNLGPQQEQEVQFYVDTDRVMKEGLYKVSFNLEYQDIDNNDYQSAGSFPFVVKKKPDIVVLSSEGEGLAGDEIELRVTVKNLGEEASDAVDLRLLKQSSQPFEMDVRSSYIGELKPGEEGTAVFRIKALRDAEVREHSMNVLLRARGDSEEGDNNIYTYTGSANVNITGQKKNLYPVVGASLLAVVLVGAFVMTRFRKR
jgi:hypothetical protein